MVAGDDAAFVQAADPLQAGRGGDADPAGEFAVGLPCVELQLGDDRRIYVVQIHEFEAYRRSNVRNDPSGLPESYA